MSPTLLPWLAALGPLLLLLPGLVPAATADRAPRRMRRAVAVAALGAAAVALLVALLLPLAGGAVPGAILHLDAISAVMLLLVAGLGAVIADYARRYLDGDPGQGRFMRWLALTLAAVMVLVLAGNLVLLGLAWVAVSLALNRLLLFYPERPAARLAARKEALVARLSDACLLGAILLAWQVFGTLEIAAIRDAARAMGGDAPPPAVHAMAVLLVAAALLRSAQVPAHGWLPEVMETPTPVSALLHAGVINAGGLLVLRMADVVALSAGALDLILLVGTITAVVGAAVMLTQTSVKLGLAWSTIAQMGFMAMQCGLGAFAAALLHMVAHALYKAHAFLTAGGVAAARRPGRAPALPLRVLLPALAGAVALVLLVGAALGMPATEAPGPAVLGAVLAMALVPMLATGVAARGGRAFAARVALMAGGVALAWFGLQSGAAALFGAALPQAVAPRGPFAILLCVLAVLAFALLLVLNVARRAPAPGPVLEALYVHLLNGFYVNAWTNRRLAPRSAPAAEGGR